MIAAARFPLRSEPANNQLERQGPWLDLVLDLVVVDGHSAVIQIARQRYPAFEAVIQGSMRITGRAHGQNGRSLQDWTLAISP